MQDREIVPVVHCGVGCGAGIQLLPRIHNIVVSVGDCSRRGRFQIACLTRLQRTVWLLVVVDVSSGKLLEIVRVVNLNNHRYPTPSAVSRAAPGTGEGAERFERLKVSQPVLVMFPGFSTTGYGS